MLTMFYCFFHNLFIFFTGFSSLAEPKHRQTTSATWKSLRRHERTNGGFYCQTGQQANDVLIANLNNAKIEKKRTSFLKLYVTFSHYWARSPGLASIVPNHPRNTPRVLLRYGEKPWGWDCTYDTKNFIQTWCILAIAFPGLFINWPVSSERRAQVESPLENQSNKIPIKYLGANVLLSFL